MTNNETACAMAKAAARPRLKNVQIETGCRLPRIGRMDVFARNHAQFALSDTPKVGLDRSHAHHVALLLHSLGGGGAQRRVATLANAFAQDGRQVDLVTLDPRGPVANLLAPSVRLVDLDVRRPLKGVLTRLHASALANYLAREKPDVMMSGVTNTHALAVAGVSRADRRTPLVLRASRHPLREIGWTDPVRRVAEIARRASAAHSYRHADGIVAVSHGVAAGLARLVGEAAPVTTILNPVICRNSDPENDAVPALDAPLIVGIGRLVRQKDFTTLLRAFALLRRHCQAELVLLGDGPERARLQKLACRLGIADHFSMPGETDMVPAWLHRAAMLVSSSLWEGLPATLIEALGAGCPVVATDCPGGSREILADGRYGTLVQMRSPVAMADAMQAMLASPPDRKKLREGAAPYRWSDQANQYLETLDRCASRSARASDAT